MSNEPETLRQLSHRVGLPMCWLRREAKAGRLPCLRVGRRFLFDHDVVNRALLKRAGFDSGQAREGDSAEGNDEQDEELGELVVALVAARRAGDFALETACRGQLECEYGVKLVFADALPAMREEVENVL